MCMTEGISVTIGSQSQPISPLTLQSYRQLESRCLDSNCEWESENLLLKTSEFIGSGDELNKLPVTRNRYHCDHLSCYSRFISVRINLQTGWLEGWGIAQLKYRFVSFTFYIINRGSVNQSLSMFGVFVFLYDISWGRHKCLHMLHQTQSTIHGKNM